MAHFCFYYYDVKHGNSTKICETAGSLFQSNNSIWHTLTCICAPEEMRRIFLGPLFKRQNASTAQKKNSTSTWLIKDARQVLPQNRTLPYKLRGSTTPRCSRERHTFPQASENGRVGCELTTIGFLDSQRGAAGTPEDNLHHTLTGNQGRSNGLLPGGTYFLLLTKKGAQGDQFKLRHLPSNI